jgi:hypothetical protein
MGFNFNVFRQRTSSTKSTLSRQGLRDLARKYFSREGMPILDQTDAMLGISDVFRERDASKSELSRIVFFDARLMQFANVPWQTIATSLKVSEGLVSRSWR